MVPFGMKPPACANSIHADQPLDYASSYLSLRVHLARRLITVLPGRFPMHCTFDYGCLNPNLSSLSFRIASLLFPLSSSSVDLPPLVWLQYCH